MTPPTSPQVPSTLSSLWAGLISTSSGRAPYQVRAELQTQMESALSLELELYVCSSWSRTVLGSEVNFTTPIQGSTLFLGSPLRRSFHVSSYGCSLAANSDHRASGCMCSSPSPHTPCAVPAPPHTHRVQFQPLPHTPCAVPAPPSVCSSSPSLRVQF